MPQWRLFLQLVLRIKVRLARIQLQWRLFLQLVLRIKVDLARIQPQWRLSLQLVLRIKVDLARIQWGCGGKAPAIRAEPSVFFLLLVPFSSFLHRNKKEENEQIKKDFYFIISIFIFRSGKSRPSTS